VLVRPQAVASISKIGRWKVASRGMVNWGDAAIVEAEDGDILRD
jgi:hypothetical protein